MKFNFYFLSFLFIHFVSYLFICSCHQLDGFEDTPTFEKVVPEDDVTDVHLIFMNHLDVGYSDYKLKGLLGNVLNTYFTKYFPAAISRSRELSDGGYIETFKYTTHPFLLDLYLNCPPNLVLSGIPVKCPSELEIMSMHRAINEGIIQWHAGAMNIQYELLTPLGIDMSLNISNRLDKYFAVNKKLRVLSQRDVPGISRGIIPHLVSNNVLGISHGINSGSATSDVPAMFRWRQAPPYDTATGAKEVLYIQNKAGYPNPPGKDPNHPFGLSADQCFKAPTTGHVLCFSFRNDNTGPPESITEILHTYEIVRARYPRAHLYASSFEKFFEILDSVREHLPVVDAEIGDTWIQGATSDPGKMSDYKSISNAFDTCYANQFCDSNDRRIVNASRFFVKLVEHTWGLNSDGDSVHWTNEEFENMRNFSAFKLVEESWNEQRYFINLTIEALENHRIVPLIKTNMNKSRQIPGSSKPNLSGYIKMSAYNSSCGSQIIEVLKDSTLRIKGFGDFQIRYRTYNESDTKYFLKYYSMGWNTGYGKPNSTINAAPVSQFWALRTDSFYSSIKDCRYYISMRPVDPTASRYYGAPSAFWMNYQLTSHNTIGSITVEWFDKNPTRLMEAIYLQFTPAASLLSNVDIFFSKINALISPYNVVQNGSQWQHGIDSKGVVLKCKRSVACNDRSIQSLNTYLVCPVTPSYGPTVWPAPLKPIQEKITGVAFPLYTNIWMTNYIFWYPYYGPNNANDKTYKAQFRYQS